MATPETGSPRRLIVALDVPTLVEAEALLDRLKGLPVGFKVGTQLFTACGPSAVEAVHTRGAEVFLDLKYHDIPNTVAQAARAATRLGVLMFNVHAAGGRAMMQAAAEAAAETAREGRLRRPLVLAVTVLTSLDRATLHREIGVPTAVGGHVLHLCRLAREAGLDGTVASAQEIVAIRTQLGRNWLIVTPGVRPAGAERHDQSRVDTPGAAARAGADYLVVGRPITTAPDPVRATEALLEELG